MDHDDFAIEPIKGLPALPPEGEHILWQGRPDWWALANDAFKLKWVAGYFVALALWRAYAVVTQIGWELVLPASTPFLVLGTLCCLILLASAWIQARASVYTITNRRIAMRIGAALTVTLNLPYRWIGSADLKLGPGGTGTLAFDLIGDTRFSYLVCWPHLRPFHMRKTKPAFRAIADADKVAELVRQTAQQRVADVASVRFAVSSSAAGRNLGVASGQEPLSVDPHPVPAE